MNRTSAKAPLTKSPGVTATERMLADFCERSFLKLWSYPNPYKDDGHELAIFSPFSATMSSSSSTGKARFPKSPIEIRRFYGIDGNGT